MSKEPLMLATGRDIALIYFICIAFIITLAPGALLGGMIYGLRLAKRKSIPYIKLIQRYAQRTADKTDEIATLTVRPIIKTTITGAQLKHHLIQILNHATASLHPTQKEPPQT
jgi:hypothetical protein